MASKDEELETYYFHLGLDFLAKVSLQQPASIERIRARLEKEAALASDEDSVALRILSNALEPYLQGN